MARGSRASDDERPSAHCGCAGGQDGGAQAHAARSGVAGAARRRLSRTSGEPRSRLFSAGEGPAAVGARLGAWISAGGPRQMTAILGISAFYHDSAAALVVDGKIVAAAQEERFSRKKHDPGFPALAAQYCLEESAKHTNPVSEKELDYIAYYEKPLLKFDRLLETYLGFAPKG